MRTSLLAIVSLFIVVSVLPLHAGGASNFLKAKVNGTVQTQTTTTPTDGRIHTTALNNARIFAEFQVSSEDYELVVAMNSTGLYLVPRSTAAALPTITVATFSTDSQEVFDTKNRAVNYSAALKNAGAVNLFQNLGGEINGTFHYTGEITAPTFKSGVVTALGRGTDKTNGGSGPALLKFKITASGVFTQAP